MISEETTVAKRSSTRPKTILEPLKTTPMLAVLESEASNEQ